MEESLEKCPICKNKLKQNYVRTEDYANRYHINCQYCGRYELFGWKMKSRFGLDDGEDKNKTKSDRLLSMAVRHKYEETGDEVLISDKTIDELKNGITIPDNPIDKVDILLTYMYNKNKNRFADNVVIPESDYPLMLVYSETELDELIRLADESDYVSYLSSKTNGNRICRIKQKGWNRIKELNATQDIKENKRDLQINRTPKEIKCFIVLGRDTYWNREVKEYLTSIGIDFIILSDKENQGKTVVEKFEYYANVDFAVCIWSPDDEGRKKGKEGLKSRVRQNVMLETGFFWGSLGRKRVFILNHKTVDIPTDFAGLVYISLTGGNWRAELLREIERLRDITSD
jgi:predicted nucleotide-binding protein